MSCINYNVYHQLYIDHSGRTALTSPIPQTICYEGRETPYPPPNSLCRPNEALRYYFANLLTGYGMAVCVPLRR